MRTRRGSLTFRISTNKLGQAVYKTILITLLKSKAMTLFGPLKRDLVHESMSNRYVQGERGNLHPEGVYFAE